MKITLKNISNLDKFFYAVSQCDSAVEVALPEGGAINLKSKLSQYFAMATMFSGGNISELTIKTNSEHDFNRMFFYMMQGC